MTNNLNPGTAQYPAFLDRSWVAKINRRGPLDARTDRPHSFPMLSTTSAASWLRADPVVSALLAACERERALGLRTAETETALAAAIGLRVEQVELGHADRLGRSIGCSVTEWELGGRYFMHCQATRNGEDYQASQPTREFPTAAARAKARAKRLADAAAKAGK